LLLESKTPFNFPGRRSSGNAVLNIGNEFLN